jgi:hypothetical protein
MAPSTPVIGFWGFGVALKTEAGNRPAGLLRLDLQAREHRQEAHNAQPVTMQTHRLQAQTCIHKRHSRLLNHEGRSKPLLSS